MNSTSLFSSLAAVVLALGLASCKKQAQADATQPLQQSFEAAEPGVKQAIASVNTSLKAGNYTEATRALAPVVSRPNLTERQKQAIGLALQQVNQAIAANPALDTKEMYELRAKMYQAVDGGKRF
jgi:Tfp pilus assembly protein PilF